MEGRRLGEIDRAANSRLLAMAKRTGYSLMQTNGQRKYGPPPHWKGPLPPKGSEVFVGKLPRDIYEDELVPIFEQVGTIYELRLMMDFSGTNRGFGFVQFTNPCDADRAVKILNNYEVRPKRYIGVVKSVDNCRLFVGGLPKNKSKQDIADELNKYVEGVTEVILYSSVVDKTKSRGFAFVEFHSHRAAAMARRKLIPGRVQLWGYELQVDWAVPEHDVDEETMSKVKVLYVRNLMISTTEQTIWKAMESVRGPECLEKVKKMKDFAFVHFSDRESAKAAMEHWNKKELDGSVVEISWAKPVHRGTQRQSKRGGYHTVQNVHPAGTGPAAIHGFLNGRGTYGSPHMQSSTSWRSGRTFVVVPPPIIGPRAPEVLCEYCHKNGWGEPCFSIMPMNSQQEDNVYMCQVVIPQYPGDQSHFQTSRVSLSVDEAKILAAEITLFHLGSAGRTAALTEGYSCTSVVPTGHVMPPPSATNYPTHNGLETQPEVTIAYALSSNHAPGYLVHGEVGGYDTQYQFMV